MVGGTDGSGEEGLGISTRGEWFRKMVHYKYVSSRLLGTEFMYGRLRISVIVARVPWNDRVEEIKIPSGENFKEQLRKQILEGCSLWWMTSMDRLEEE